MIISKYQDDVAARASPPFFFERREETPCTRFYAAV